MEDHPKIIADQNSFLEAIPSRDEVENAVWACGTDTALGFDGYNFKFIREMWGLVQDDIYEFVLDFFNSSSSARSINVTWVTLIPKRVDPQSIDYYRPICMVGALYKTISKLLSFRLKVVISPLINESQRAFVMNRQILDYVLVVNESLKWLKKKKIHEALLKLDFQKAYDSVNWSFS